MDGRLRELERKLQIGGDSQDSQDLQNFLAGAYRAGYFRTPTRKQIKAILRRQMGDAI